MSESRTTLDRALRRPGDRMKYEYDFGDSWEHDILFEAALPIEPDGVYPRVEAGKRASPGRRTPSLARRA
jgi:Plasmid pRiA4b ORF-3-like protein